MSELSSRLKLLDLFSGLFMFSEIQNVKMLAMVSVFGVLSHDIRQDVVIVDAGNTCFVMHKSN